MSCAEVCLGSMPSPVREVAGGGICPAKIETCPLLLLLLRWLVQLRLLLHLLPLMHLEGEHHHMSALQGSLVCCRGCTENSPLDCSTLACQ